MGDEIKISRREEYKKTVELRKEFTVYLKEFWVGNMFPIHQGTIKLSDKLIDKIWNLISNRIGYIYNKGYKSGYEKGLFEAGVKFGKQSPSNNSKINMEKKKLDVMENERN